jgi:hypothetical protein
MNSMATIAMAEQPPKAVEQLADDINELESLIAAAKAPAAQAPIPILDDVVVPAVHEENEAAGRPGAEELENRLLRRVDAELGELAQVIREIIRRCIREELGPKAAADRPPAADESEPGR